MLLKSKQDYIETLANNQKPPNLSCIDYWNTLKSFIKPAHTSSEIPPLHQNGCYVSDSTEKANILNNNRYCSSKDDNLFFAAHWLSWSWDVLYYRNGNYQNLTTICLYCRFKVV